MRGASLIISGCCLHHGVFVDAGASWLVKMLHASMLVFWMLCASRQVAVRSNISLRFCRCCTHITACLMMGASRLGCVCSAHHGVVFDAEHITEYCWMLRASWLVSNDAYMPHASQLVSRCCAHRGLFMNAAGIVACLRMLRASRRFCRCVAHRCCFKMMLRASLRDC